VLLAFCTRKKLRYEDISMESARRSVDISHDISMEELQEGSEGSKN
jgi:hypothetical protein